MGDECPIASSDAVPQARGRPDRETKPAMPHMNLSNLDDVVRAPSGAQLSANSAGQR